MYSSYHKRKSAVAERFIRTLKDEIHKISKTIHNTHGE